jgi:hypothetical protein
MRGLQERLLAQNATSLYYPGIGVGELRKLTNIFTTASFHSETGVRDFQISTKNANNSVGAFVDLCALLVDPSSCHRTSSIASLLPSREWDIRIRPEAQGEYELIQVLSSFICASLNLLQARVAFLSEKAHEGVAEVVTPLQVGMNSACPSGFA